MIQPDEAQTLIDEVLVDKKAPVGARPGSTPYLELKLLDYINLSEALTHLKQALTVSEVLTYNFGLDDPQDLQYMVFYLGQQVAKSKPISWAAEGLDDLNGMGGDSWIWVPGDAELADPSDTQVALGKPKEPAVGASQRPPKFPAPRKSPLYFAPRSQEDAPGIFATIDTGIKAGDILLNHHPVDRDIADMTTSWPTHAGMAVNEKWAVDANKRKDPLDRSILADAVQIVPMLGPFSVLEDFDGFFDKRPEGGLIFRYVGAEGDNEARIDAVRAQAAEWAFEQAGKKYRFGLRTSRIVDSLRTDAAVAEKKFDTTGKAVGKDGHRATYYSKSQGKAVETEYHNIYCAELVWRAYRQAGVNIVDPKALDLLGETKQAVPAFIVCNIEKIYQHRSELERMRLLPANVARWAIVKLARKQAHNKFYFCAPWQLGGSPLTVKIAQLPPSEDTFKTIAFDDFRQSGLHPLTLARAVFAKTKEIVKRRLKDEKIRPVGRNRKKAKAKSVKDDLKAYMNSSAATMTIETKMKEGNISRKKAKRQVRQEFESILNQAYDEDTDKLETEAAATVTEDEIEAKITEGEDAWKQFKTKHNIAEFQATVTKPWLGGHKSAPELRLGEDSGSGYNPKFADSTATPCFAQKDDFNDLLN